MKCDVSLFRQSVRCVFPIFPLSHFLRSLFSIFLGSIFGMKMQFRKLKPIGLSSIWYYGKKLVIFWWWQPLLLHVTILAVNHFGNRRRRHWLATKSIIPLADFGENQPGVYELFSQTNIYHSIEKSVATWLASRRVTSLHAMKVSSTQDRPYCSVVGHPSSKVVYTAVRYKDPFDVCTQET